MFYPRSIRTSSKRSRPKDEDTYILTIDIIKGSGSDSKQTKDVVPALALFNASSDHSWISKRFAERLGIIIHDSGSQSVKLAWKCPALGRYVQRTVFMIAPLADFDVLFAEQIDENCRPSERDQFQRSIQRGLLKGVAQKGIADGTMLRVVQTPSVEPADTTEPIMPTIAQLEAQLLHDTEGHRNYHRKHSCNICSVNALHIPACCGLLDLERRQSTSLTTNENVIDRYMDSQTGSEPPLLQDDGVIYPVKRTKLSQEMSTIDDCQSLLTDSRAPERCSPSLSPPSSRSQALGPPEKTTLQEPVSTISALAPSYSGVSHRGDSTHRELGDRVSVKRRSLRPRRQGVANSASRGASTSKVTTTERAVSFTKKTSSDRSDADTTDSDSFDPEYWTWDEVEQNYYHIDKASSKRLWYEAPP